jgi:hypothetical protein
VSFQANPLVTKIASAMYAARVRSARQTWEKLADHQREGYCETVQEVMLAAMNAGLVIREVTDPKDAPLRSGPWLGTLADTGKTEPSPPLVAIEDTSGNVCSVCACSNADRCSMSDGSRCRWVRPDLCSGCVNG